MDRALYVGVKPGNRSYLLHQGYVRALESFGWSVEWLSNEEGADADPARHDLVLWNGGVPERALRRVRRGQTFVAMNGAGDDLSHYARYAERISLATSSFHYLDEPATNLTRFHLAPRRVLSPQSYYVAKYAWRFFRYAQPRYFRDCGIRFMHLPFASDPALFHPLPQRTPRYRWVFCGLLVGRTLVPKLMRASAARGWAHLVVAPELKNTVDPIELNAIYNQATLGVNEQHLMTFAREVNQRGFDYGMAGLPQISDMGYLCGPLFGPSCRPYAGRLATGPDHEYALRLVERSIAADPQETHAHFAKHHSFAARVAAISVALGVDLTRGRMTLAEHAAAATGWTLYRD
jgi:hypothetical protein